MTRYLTSGQYRQFWGAPKESLQNLVKIFYLYNVKIDQVTPSPPLSLRMNFTMTITKGSKQNYKIMH